MLTLPAPRSLQRSPHSLTLTPFHLLLLYSDRLVAMSRISLSVVWERVLDTVRVLLCLPLARLTRLGAQAHFGKLNALVQSESHRTIWLQTSHRLFQARDTRHPRASVSVLFVLTATEHAAGGGAR